VNKEKPEMPAKKYIVELTPEERQELRQLTDKGTVKARTMKRAQILLKADEGWKDEAIMAAVDVSRPMVERVRQRFVQEGLQRALTDGPRPGAKRKLDGRGEAKLIALACSTPPDAQEHWALRLLADQLVELGVVTSISHETVRRVLKKTL
jgi:transposase